MSAFDDSFGPTAHDGGWGNAGDSSFAQQHTAGSSELDKVAVPVTIQNLSEIPRSDDKVIVGTLPFTTVRVVGEVVNVVRLGANSETVEYHIQDEPGGPTFAVNVFKIDPTLTTQESPVEGNFIHAVGKLRSFDGRLTISSFNIRIIEDMGEVKAHKLEAQLAELYYSKGIAQKAGNLPPEFADTMLRGAVDGSATTSKGAASGGAQQHVATSGAAQPNGSHVFADEAPNNSNPVAAGLQGARAKLFAYISQHGPTHEEGLHIDELLRVPGVNKGTARKDLDFLANEGHIYTMADEDHFQIC